MFVYNVIIVLITVYLLYRNWIERDGNIETWSSEEIDTHAPGL